MEDLAAEGQKNGQEKVEGACLSFHTTKHPLIFRLVMNSLFLFFSDMNYKLLTLLYI